MIKKAWDRKNESVVVLSILVAKKEEENAKTENDTHAAKTANNSYFEKNIVVLNSHEDEQYNEEENLAIILEIFSLLFFDHQEHVIIHDFQDPRACFSQSSMEVDFAAFLHQEYQSQLKFDFPFFLFFLPAQGKCEHNSRK